MLDVAQATTAVLTITETILPSRSETTREVLLEGIDDCSVDAVTKLLVQDAGEISAFEGRDQTTTTSLWSGFETSGNVTAEGSARLSATKQPTSTRCFINAHITTAVFMKTIIVGTFADGTIWADVVDLTQEEAGEND